MTQGEAVFPTVSVRGNQSHKDPRGEIAELADRRRGHPIAKAEGAARMYFFFSSRARRTSLFLFQHLRTHNLPRPLLRPKHPAALVGLPPAPRRPEPDPEVLRALYDVRTTPYRSSFLSRLNGFVIHHSSVVAVDWEVRSPWMDLMEDIRAHYALKL
jgi:hypothetical protein